MRRGKCFWREDERAASAFFTNGSNVILALRMLRFIDTHMVEHFDCKQLSGANDVARHLDVGLAQGGITAQMVVAGISLRLKVHQRWHASSAFAHSSLANKRE